MSEEFISGTDMEKELKWFKRVLNLRMLLRFVPEERPQQVERLPAEEQSGLLSASAITDFAPPDLSGDKSGYSWLVNNYQLNPWERLTLLLALLPHIRPQLLDVFIVKNHATGQPVTEFGGVKNSSHSGFLPTGETALYLLAGDDLDLRFALMEMFDEEHIFHQKNILSLEDAGKGDPRWCGALVPSMEIIDLVTRGYVRPPRFGNDFPAKQISTSMDWEDLVLSPMTLRQVEEVKVWLKHGASLHEELGMHKRLKPGYRALFYGPPGTGKTLTACLLGKFLGRPVFRIDLSMVVNKYIGETEKNLAKIFDKAEHASWILFFDEADALFGKRTSSNSSNDRYANQEVSYLLQRIEDFPGIVILASNMKSNIDDAFARRFQSMVHFASPKGEERRRLWKNAFSSKLQFSEEVDIAKFADKYDLSGGHITNVVAWCSLMALDKGDYLVTESMLREGIARELAKEGRTL